MEEKQSAEIPMYGLGYKKLSVIRHTVPYMWQRCGCSLKTQGWYALALTLITLLILAPFAYGQQLEVKIVSLTSPVSPGDDATITIQTGARADCLITVRYKSGPSKARGLVPKTADSQGRVSWTWRVGSRTTPGTWPIIVTCSRNERQARLQTTLVVR